MACLYTQHICFCDKNFEGVTRLGIHSKRYFEDVRAFTSSMINFATEEMVWLSSREHQHGFVLLPLLISVLIFSIYLSAFSNAISHRVRRSFSQVTLDDFFYFKTNFTLRSLCVSQLCYVYTNMFSRFYMAKMFFCNWNHIMTPIV